MFIDRPESWFIILISCVLGFIIGQWIKSRRNKADKNTAYLNGLKRRIMAEQDARTKKGKKARKADRKKGSLQ